MERSFGCIAQKESLTTPCGHAVWQRRKTHQWGEKCNERMRERERERDEGVFCWLLVLSSMKTSGATDSLDDWNYWVESNDRTRGPMKMTWTRWEQGELEITWLLDLPGRQKILQKLCCFFPIFLSRPNPPSHQPQESLRNFLALNDYNTFPNCSPATTHGGS